MGVLDVAGRTLLVVACGVFLFGPQVFAIFTEEQCFDGIKSVDSGEFVEKTLACQNAGETNEKCCSEINSMYGYFGTLDGCLCGSDFHSMILGNLPVDKGVTAEKFVDNLKACGIPAKGLGCGGESEAPVVQAQGIVRNLIGAAVALRRGGGVGGGHGYHTHSHGDDDDDDDDDDGGARPIPVPKYNPSKPPSSPRSPPSPPAPPSPRPPPAQPKDTATPKQTAAPKQTGAQQGHPAQPQQGASYAPNGCQTVASGVGAVDFSGGESCVIVQG